MKADARSEEVQGLSKLLSIYFPDLKLQSSEYESDSDSEEPPKPMFRPVFVPK